MASIAAVVALGAVGLLVIAVGTAPAGNRTPVPTLIGFPGPGEVTYGQNVAYTATLPNEQSSNFTHAQFHNPIPATTGGPAILRYASCPGQLTATEFVCNEISVGAGATAKVTIVWQTPASGSSSNCPSLPVCMTNRTFWTIKEGTGKPGSSGPDTFQSPLVETALLVVPDFVEAGGYALNACTNPATQKSLETNAAVGPTNKVATKVCASTVPGQLHDPGVAIEVDEGIGPFNAGVTESSSICIPGPGESCENPDYLPWTFTQPPATFTFTIDNTTLPSGEKIDKVFHDGVLDANDPDFSCSITIVNKTKTTIVTCQSADNGWWDFG